MRVERTTVRVAFFHLLLFLFYCSSADPPTALAVFVLMYKIDEATISSTRSFVHRDVYFVAMPRRIIATKYRYQKTPEVILSLYGTKNYDLFASCAISLAYATTGDILEKGKLLDERMA